MTRQIETAFQGAIICRGYRRTWAFPREVSDLLQRETRGQTVLQLFGGHSGWGVRLDADRTTRPDVVGNAFYPPFRCESFDVVICDPPYRPENFLWQLCMTPAACLARRRVWWFSPFSMGGRIPGMRVLRWWAVSPGDLAALRYLVELERVRHPKHCWPRPRKNRTMLPAQIRKYDWRSRIEQPNFQFAASVRVGDRETPP